MNNRLPDLKKLNELLNYDPDTGIFTWKVARGRVTKGTVAGQVNKRWGYRTITIDKVKYYAHRLAWYISTGDDPGDLDIDHKNHNRDDNRIENLILATRSENCSNRATPALYARKHRNKYLAQLTFRGVKYYLGLYDTPEECRSVTIEKREQLRPM